MTLEEAIKHAEEVAEKKFDNAVCIMDKGKSDVALENAEECKRCAEEHRQLAEWLNDYKRLLEQKTCEDDITIQAVLEMAYDMSEIDGEHFTKPWMVVDVEDIQKLPSVKPQEPKTGHWIEHFDESGKWYECDQCHTDWGGSVNFCPNCGADMGSEDKE